VRSNLEIFDREISAQLEQLFYKPDLRRDVQFVFRVNSVSKKEKEVKFLISVIKKTAEKNKIWASFSDLAASNDSVFNAFIIDIISLGVKYPGFANNKFLGTKIVHRQLTAVIRVEAAGVNYFYNNTDSILINYKDRVDYNDIEDIETEDYNFTRASHPHASVWEEIVFPAAIIIVSVAAAVLFFTIRSK